MDRPEFRDNNEQLNNNEIQISISEDCMSATLYLSAPYYDVNTDNNSVFTYDQVIGELSDKGVKMGIDDAMLHKMIEERIYNRDVVIAQGKQMVNGEDGRYEFFFDMDVNGKPTIRSDGTVDYMNLKLFESVKEGQLLAKYYHPTKGIFGFDVKGRLLTPKPGKPKSVLRGKGFKVSENGDEYYAALSGKVEYRNYDLKVINLLEIDGDVDLNTGNIDFDGDVNVKGNVITGVRINALGNIYIGGHVEGAVIMTQKDLILQEGINAKGIGKIYAKGNITGRFFENAEVYAEGDVNAGYILNSNITAIGKIIIDGAKGVIYGGELTGVMGIETPLLGNNAHTITTVRVGPSKKLQTEYANLLIKIKEIVSEVKEELTAQGIPFKDDVETGIMIETPAAALISDELAKEVDFFSVGTNDLTQYTLAIDRQNRMLEPFCNTHHKAVLKLIRMAADNAHKEGKWIGICGELGADITLTEEFLKMGIDELSVSANMVLKVRDKVRSINLKG